MGTRVSRLALLRRFAVLLGLIAGAAWLYLRVVAHHRRWWRSTPERLTASQRRFARRFVAVAVRYKGGLIKLGQVASLRVDVLPPEVSDELAALQDRVDPHPVEEIESQIERELGRPAQQLFESFDREPLAAASLGQVHHARTRAGGEEVAVKVLYPDVERSVAVDLVGARIGLWLFDFVTTTDLRQVFAQLRRSLLGEMDYEREGRAAEEVAANLARAEELAPRVRVPRIHWETSSRRVLTMEFVPGAKINDREAVAALGVERRELALLAARAFLHMMFEDGFFHCDPHPGNLLVDPEGRLGILDFGMHERISPQLARMIRQNVLATATRDPALYARSLHGAGMIEAGDVPVVEEIAKISFDPRYWNLTPREVAELDFGEYFRQMRTQLKRVRSFHLPDGVVLWSRALTLLLGLTSELAPELRPLDVVGPYVMRFLREDPPGRAA